MKILLLTDRMDTGGAETHVRSLATELKALGNDVEVLSAGGWIADRLEAAGIPQHRFPALNKSLAELWRSRRKLRRLIEAKGYDVVHAHTRRTAFLIRKIGQDGIPARIVTIHARFRRPWLFRLFCKISERVIAVSEDLRAYAHHECGIPEERIDVIPNGIDRSEFHAGEPSCETSLKKPLRILFASRLDRDCSRGADCLLDLFDGDVERFPNVTLHILGDGSESGRIAFRAAAINAKRGKKAVTVSQTAESVAEAMRQASVFVGVSRAAMEAAACGCAVILCGNEGYGGILRADNAEEAALSNFCARGNAPVSEERLWNDLNRLLGDPDLCRRAAEEAQNFVRSRYDLRAVCRKTLTVYRRAVHPPYRATVLIGGYFGCGNAGDDAILMGFLAGMHETAPEIRVLALTGNPTRDRLRFGIDCYNRSDPIAVRDAMRRADAFLCGGGSLLQNLTSRRSLSYYLGLLRLSQRMNKKTILFAAGIGPVSGARARARMAAVLNRCDRISLRDPESLRFLSVIGVERSLLFESADPALLLPVPDASRTSALLASRKLPLHTPRFCVVLQGQAGIGSSRGAAVAAVRMLCRQNSLLPLFPVFSESDRAGIRPIAEEIGGEVIPVSDPRDLAALLAGSNAILSMRLHAMILAASTGTPAVGIPADPRDPKIRSFSLAAGMECVEETPPPVGTVVDRVEHFCLHRAPACALIPTAVAEMRKKAWKDLAIIAGMIYNKGE